MIRALREDDVEALLQLFADVAAERLWIGTEPGFDRALYRSGLRAMINGEGAAFVAIEDRRIAGYIGVRPHAEYGHVLGMFVAAAQRGRGTGRALLERALQWASERGLPDISLLVFAHNERAMALYRSCGFVAREYYANDVTRQTGEVWDTILMTKAL